MDTGPAIAAIDCGTNSTRLLVADANGQPLVRLMRITRLGQGVDATGRLAPEAIERCLAVLPVADVAIEEPTIEEVVKSLYGNRSG